MHELQTVLVQPHGYPIVVNRDLNWTPRRFKEIPL